LEKNKELAQKLETDIRTKAGLLKKPTEPANGASPQATAANGNGHAVNATEKPVVAKKVTTAKPMAKVPTPTNQN
jgi:hypothetical protein